MSVFASPRLVLEWVDAGAAKARAVEGVRTLHPCVVAGPGCLWSRVLVFLATRTGRLDKRWRRSCDGSIAIADLRRVRLDDPRAGSCSPELGSRQIPSAWPWPLLSASGHRTRHELFLAPGASSPTASWLRLSAEMSPAQPPSHRVSRSPWPILQEVAAVAWPGCLTARPRVTNLDLGSS